MANISLHLSVSESFKSVASDLVVFGAVLFVAMIVAAFCAGLILGRFWHLWKARRGGDELAAGSWQPVPPEVTK